ncbi:uncharacterized protein LAESUDRAFT_651916 [Laetiporus sulphureus 93-53]|uniref:DUF4218 domain-containing protein n=1 Tax=Laetiporus sulphureus 93-53 TaxID=1314785 RepID=A0A165EJ70_9APHY|nr:uncharacterized protein LAESUDRAFT_651916 [Laetiporus sulphureus 93-53]KZT07161.1 hypothetical protein LAESUDRAFT_651916 [Laetiporus sulphureus 93-53]
MILGKDVLEEIQSDMIKTSLPNWMGRAPSDLGSASAGTLSADQWRTICLVRLPITLIRLWSTDAASDRKKRLLENYLDLVIAIVHGTTRQTSPGKITIYNHYILKYVRGLRFLFPNVDLFPNNHYSLHLGSMLERFGPPQGYWAFPFERYIRLVHNVNTSQRDGEMHAIATCR